MLRQTGWVGFYLFCTTITSHAQTQISQFEGKRIVAIQYLPSATIDPADLAKALPFKVGDLLHATTVADAIDRFFATGRFEDIAVEAQPSGDGVIVRFVTKPAYFVGGVNVEGKILQPPNRGQVSSSAQFSLGTIFRDEDLPPAVESIDALMKSNGLYEAKNDADNRT